MARKLTSSLPLDDLEDEILYTRAALKADTTAAALLSLTDSWLPLVDAHRATDRTFREKEADVDAARILANQYLDLACMSFGDGLLMDVNKDREAPRWRQFFADPPSRLVQKALSEQVEVVSGWLALSEGTDPVLDTYRTELTAQSSRASRALVDTRSLTVLRGTVQQERETLVERLTQGRDALRETLGQLAREKSLPRTWPDAFFKTGK